MELTPLSAGAWAGLTIATFAFYDEVQDLVNFTVSSQIAIVELAEAGDIDGMVLIAENLKARAALLKLSADGYQQQIQEVATDIAGSELSE